ALGGASTQSVEVAVRAGAAGLALRPEALFRYGTIAALAEHAAPEPAPAAAGGPNTVIESLGVYLPPAGMTTGEVLDGCVNPVKLPFEQLTGIRSRRVAGDTEFAIDLARNALADCLDRSAFRPADIDLLICCSISRYDAPGSFAFEPSTAARL